MSLFVGQGLQMIAANTGMAATWVLETFKAKAMLTWQCATSFHLMVHKADCTPAVDIRWLCKRKLAISMARIHDPKLSSVVSQPLSVMMKEFNPSDFSHVQSTSCRLLYTYQHPWSIISAVLEVFAVFAVYISLPVGHYSSNNSDVCLATNVRVLMSPPCISLPEGRPILFALPFQLLVTGGTQWNTVEQQDFHIASKGDWNEGHMKGMPQEGIRRNPILQHLLQLCPLWGVDSVHPILGQFFLRVAGPHQQIRTNLFHPFSLVSWCQTLPDHLHVLKSSQVLIHQLLVSDREPTAVHTKTHSNKCSFMQLSKPRHLRGDDISQIALQKHRCTSSNSHQSHHTKLPGASAGAGVKRNKRSKSSRSTLTTSHNMNCITWVATTSIAQIGDSKVMNSQDL